MSLIERFNIGMRKSFAFLNQGLELNDSIYEIKNVYLPVILKLDPPASFFDSHGYSEDSCCIYNNDAAECPLNLKCKRLTLDLNDIVDSTNHISQFIKDLTVSRKSLQQEQLKLIDNRCIPVLADVLNLEPILSYLSLSNALDDSFDKGSYIHLLLDILISNFELLNEMIRPPASLLQLNDSKLPIFQRVNQNPSANPDILYLLLEEWTKILDFLKSSTYDCTVIYMLLDQTRHPPILIYNDQSINVYTELNHLKLQSILFLQTLYGYCDLNWHIYHRNISLVYPTTEDEYFHIDRLSTVINNQDKLNAIKYIDKNHKNSLVRLFTASEYGSTVIIPLLQLNTPFLTSELVGLLLLFSQSPEILERLREHNIDSELLKIVEEENGVHIASVISQVTPLTISNITKSKTEIEHALKLTALTRNSLLLLLQLYGPSKTDTAVGITNFISNYLTVYSLDSILKVTQMFEFNTTHLALVSKCLSVISYGNSELSLQKISIELLYVLTRFKPNSASFILSTEMECFYSELCKSLWTQNLTLMNMTANCFLLKQLELSSSILDSKSKMIYDKYRRDDFALYQLVYLLSIGNRQNNKLCLLLLDKLLHEEMLNKKYWDTITLGTNIYSIQNWLQSIIHNINEDARIEEIPIVLNLITVAIVPSFDLNKLQHVYSGERNVLELIGSLLESIVEMSDFHASRYSSEITSIVAFYLRFAFHINYSNLNDKLMLKQLSWNSIITIMSLKEYHTDFLIAVGLSAILFGLSCYIFQDDVFTSLSIDPASSVSNYPNSFNSLINSPTYASSLTHLDLLKLSDSFSYGQLQSGVLTSYIWKNYDLCNLVVCITVYKQHIHEKAVNIMLEMTQKPQAVYTESSRTISVNLVAQLSNAINEQQQSTSEIAHLLSTISKLNRQISILAKAYFQSDESLRRAKYELEHLNNPWSDTHKLQVEYSELLYKHNKLLELLGRIEERYPEAVADCKNSV